MKGPVVVDATCLIRLERIGRLDLLPALFEPVLLPPAVAGEFGRVEPWLRVQVPRDLALVATLRASVDAGEAEALVLAGEQALRLAPPMTGRPGPRRPGSGCAGSAPSACCSGPSAPG